MNSLSMEGFCLREKTYSYCDFCKSKCNSLHDHQGLGICRRCKKLCKQHYTHLIKPPKIKLPKLKPIKIVEEYNETILASTIIEEKIKTKPISAKKLEKILLREQIEKSCSYPYQSLQNKLNRMQHRSISKNLEFTLDILTLANLQTDPICYYCGIKIDQPKQLHIDRKNNKIGYTKENCVASCEVCNRTKNEYFTSEEMKIIAKLIHQTFGKPLGDYFKKSC